MNRTRSFVAWALLALALVLLALAMFGATSAHAAPAGRPCLVAAAGDIGKSPTSGEKSAVVIRKYNPSLVLAAGDLVYPEGTEEQYSKNYAPWRPFKHKTAPTPGNHDEYSNLAGYNIEWQNRQHKTDYAFIHCGWRILSINTGEQPENEPERIARAAKFVLSQRALFMDAPILILTHHPGVSSGSSHGAETGPLKPLWDAAKRAKVSIWVAGHDHHGEVFAEDAGLRQFIAGIGGADTNPPSHDPGADAPASIWAGEVHGALFLALRPDGSYDWAFMDSNFKVHNSGRDTRSSYTRAA